MDPGVPFALLGSVQLLAIAAWTGLAVAVVALNGFRSGRALLLAAGALLLAGVDTRTGLRFGTPTSDYLALARAAGALLLAAGAQLGALNGRARADDPHGGRAGVGAGLAGVVIPLGASPGASLLAGVTGALAALTVVRSRRDTAGSLVAGGVLLSAAAALAGYGAGTSPATADVALLLRGGGSVLLMAGLVVLANASLLSKVVAAILAGVLVMACAAVGVVGTVVVRAYNRQAASLVEQAATGRVQALDAVGDRAVGLAPLVSAICTTRPRAVCDATLAVAAPRTKDFVVTVTAKGVTADLGGRAPLTVAERLGLLEPGGPVEAVLGSKGAAAIRTLPTKVALTGAAPGIAVVAVLVPQGGRPDPAGPPTKVLVYGVRIDDQYTSADFDAGGYGLSFLAGDPPAILASNLSDNDRRRLVSVATARQVGRGLPADGLTVQAQGADPTVRFLPLQGVGETPVAVLALSRDASTSLAAQRDALRILLLTALITTALVGGLAILLGRRTVEPVRRLTAAARRVSAGDLTASAGVTSQDEVGTLSRTFDGMTASLSRLTGDLRSSAERLETVLASMSDGLVATDRAGRVTSINPAALAMIGHLEDDQVLGRALERVVELRDATGQPLAVEVRDQDVLGQVVRSADGAVTSVRVAVTALAGGNGLVLVLRDTTREREVERMKTEFLSNVSHELRTPLTPIRGYADLLLNRANLTPGQVRTFATTIRDESVRMGRVVDLLVDVAALEAGRVTVTPRPVSVKELLDDRLREWREKAPERASDLRRRVARGLPQVMVDPMWVGKALDELLDNAVKYTPPGSHIMLTAGPSEDPERVRVSVRDHGPGIHEDDRDSVFTSFEQVDGSATRRVGGLGLGLAFVRRLADDAGFPLNITSHVGKGTELSLCLPIVTVRDGRPAARSRRTSRPTA